MEVFGELLGCPRIGLRLEVLHRPMCPRWHRDHNGIRLLCTWLGPGTQWLDDAASPVSDPAQLPADAPPSGQAAPFDLVLLKADLPRSNPRKPLPVMTKIAVSDFTRVATSRPATSSVSLPAPASACCSDRTRRH
ncbi:DUF1826 domain-containing protein [Thiohalocapsa sp.]|uniref:DUF1826 domain-containing protein n=1 Tax=Thiohalocapsa sp. TaxID=2497641 RepID=UPI00345BE1C0